jgi:colicin import membrane protein
MTEDEKKAARAAELDAAIKKADAAKAAGDADASVKLDKMLAGLDSLASRMDDIEAEQKAAATKAKADAEVANLTPEELAAKKAKEAEADEDDEDLNRKPGDARPLAADARQRREGRLVDAQLRADAVAHVFGAKAPAPITGEGSLNYRRRLLREYQHHSRNVEFKNIDLATVDSKVLAGIERSIYSDAVAAGASPAPLPDGQLREVRQTDEAGRVHKLFFGEPKAWMRQFSSNRRRVSSIRNQS